MTISIKIGSFLAVFVGLVLGSTSMAYACKNGQVLKPGDSCDLTVKWGFDHWIKAEFPDDGGNNVEFSHLEGACQISLFGPPEVEGGLLGPDQEPIRVSLPGEYHLFTRATIVAQQACRYRVAVN